MFDSALTPYAFMGLIALAVGLLAYMAAFPFLTGERRAEKRLEGVAKSKANRVGSRQQEDALQNRRKQVQENMKEAEKKKAAKNKLTMKLRLLRAGLDVTPRQYYIACTVMGAVALVASLVSGLSFVASAMIGFTAGLGLPRWIVRFLTKRRQGKFTNEFANAIDVIVRGVKTGLPLTECLDIISRESPEPVRGEFVELVEGQRLGIPLPECFDRMMERMPLPEVNFFAIVILIQQQAGGNLAEALGNLSGVLRSRKMLAAKVQALSSEAKASAAILAGLPFIVMFMVYLTSPDYINLLFIEKMGHVMLAFAAFWMFCGLYIMRQMINFKY